jgi:hypothetical protein
MPNMSRKNSPETPWPADSVCRRKVSELIPYARNSRTHSEGQIAQIAASIKEWGWTTPILLDEESGIIAGHGRVLAAQKLGIAEVPCMVATGWTAAQKRAYIIADNKLALNAGWDEEMLGLELAELREEDFDLGLLGFDDFAIEQFLNPPEPGDEEPDSSSKEIDVDGMEMECRCPKCGFEFDPKSAS